MTKCYGKRFSEKIFSYQLSHLDHELVDKLSIPLPIPHITIYGSESYLVHFTLKFTLGLTWLVITLLGSNAGNIYMIDSTFYKYNNFLLPSLLMAIQIYYYFFLMLRKKYLPLFPLSEIPQLYKLNMNLLCLVFFLNLTKHSPQDPYYEFSILLKWE